MRLRMRWRKVAALAASLVMFGTATPAWPQYPGKPVRVIVPFAAGGTPDVVGRIVSQQLAAQTGQAFVVENRPGADGVVGAQTVAEAPPDGYTLLVTSSSFVVNPSFHKKLPFDVVRDFEPVSNLAVTEAYILGVNPGLPVRTVQEFIALARRSDSKISFGSPGVGNGLHLAAELFKSLTRTQMVHVPYRGAAPAVTGLIAGRRSSHVHDAAVVAPLHRGRENTGAGLHCRQTLWAPPRRADHGGSRRTRNGGARQLDRNVCARKDARCDPRPAPRRGAEGGRNRCPA